MAGDFSIRIPPVGKVHTEDGFDKIADCFNTMAEELSRTETLRADFIANVSHELKTPLAVIQNYGTMLQSPNLKYIRVIPTFTEGRVREDEPCRLFKT